MSKLIPGLICATVMAVFSYTASGQSAQPCDHYTSTRQAFFGDFHVHTRYSLDASTQGTRTTPDEAYRFARGEAIGIQPWTAEGEAQRQLQLDRPLDFAMVSDHAELIGEVHMCNTADVSGYDSWQCGVYRRWPRVAFYLFNYVASMRASHLGLCGDNDQLCLDAARAPWQLMREAAARHNDPAGDCQFSTFVGYEWTGMRADSGGNLHRNVVFANDQVPPLPPSYIDGPQAPALWRSLDEQCIDTDSGCDALAIPHNSNLSAGYMFALGQEDGTPMTAEYAALRQRMEPIMEVMQHKGASECYYAPGVVADELCAFEQLPVDNISGLPRDPKPTTGFLRQTLSDGLKIQQQVGVNPYRLGVVASTDTHLGAPGAAAEDRFLGHGGAGVPARDEIPSGLPDKLEYNPGGLAVIWAEQNRRENLFQGMRRREVYGTSGPRIISRFFGGWDLPQDLCERDERIAIAYAQGVPMGSDLPAIQTATPASAPAFLVAASRDPGVTGKPGMPLQRIQIVKGWLDAAGNHRERVFDVAGGDNDAGVDLRTCEPQGAGHAQLCATWRDPDFDAEQAAWYYSRVVENPSCRWSQRQCVAQGVDCDRPETIGDGLEGCCAAEHRPIIQERAWSSPIWYQAANTKD